MLYDELFEKLPNLKTIVEAKATEIANQKIAEKDVEIQQLKQDNINTMIALADVYEQLLSLQQGGVA